MKILLKNVIVGFFGHGEDQNVVHVDGHTLQAAQSLQCIAAWLLLYSRSPNGIAIIASGRLSAWSSVWWYSLVSKFCGP